MKKFNFIGMALFTAMLSLSVTACCSGDDDDLLGGGTSGATTGTTSGGQSGNQSGDQSGTASSNQSGDPSTSAVSLAGTTWTVVRATGQDEHWGRDFNNYSASFNSDGTTVITPSSRWGNPQWSQDGSQLKLTYPDKVLIMNITFTSATTGTADGYWEGNEDNLASHATFTLQRQ